MMTATPLVALVTGAAVLRRIVPAQAFDKSIRKLNRMTGDKS
jgi:hypothetical protein